MATEWIDDLSSTGDLSNVDELEDLHQMSFDDLITEAEREREEFRAISLDDIIAGCSASRHDVK